jgi:NAD(P)-dependent dehydrogenase (short-subunit alcohol dehydrogenase family)
MEDSAIVIGSSGGIGGALVAALQNAGSRTVIGLSRQSNPPLDLTDEASIASAAAAIAGTGLNVRQVIVATGILHRGAQGPEKALRDLDPVWMLENYRVNAVGPALIAKHFLPLMPRSGRALFAVLSARVGSISDNRLGGWHSYRASKAALNMLMRNIAIEATRKNPESIAVGLHPGTVETPLSAPFKGNPAHERFAPDRAARQLLTVLEGLTPAHSGQLIAYDGTVIDP